MASVTILSTPESGTTGQTPAAPPAATIPPRSPWAYGGPYSHDAPVPIVTESATLGDLDSLGRL